MEIAGSASYARRVIDDTERQVLQRVEHGLQKIPDPQGICARPAAAVRQLERRVGGVELADQLDMRASERLCCACRINALNIATGSKGGHPRTGR